MLGEVSPSGTVTAFRKYDVYGGVRSGGSGTGAHKFVGSLGHPSDDNTGLIYMQARYMDPVAGRFVSEDPGRHGANCYAYCGNSPTGGVDPDGKNWILEIVVAGILILRAFGLAEVEIPIGAAICAVLAVIAFVWSIAEAIHGAYEAKDKIDKLLEKQRQWGPKDEAMADAIVTGLNNGEGSSMPRLAGT